MIDQLEAGYAVRREDGRGVDVELCDRYEAVEVVRLSPGGGAAALTFGFTEFPSVVVRFGLWRIEAFPSCGCDACDEQPHELVEELEGQIASVTSGHFSERLTRGLRPRVAHAFEAGNWGWSRRTRKEVRAMPGRGLHRWDAWPRR
jgi:hypothetical protein